MGVPSLFVSLVRKYPNIIFHNPRLLIDNLYLDFNCGIHPVCYKVLEKYPNWTNVDWIESKMLDEIINYLDLIIKFVNPSKLIYIAIDGPAPVAKIKQQRQRRYKSAIDRKSNWNNSKITPGTIFMAKVSKCIKKYMRKSLHKIKIIFSDSNVPSEGEHKIFQHILKTSNLKYCIYGLDADLIFLGLSSQKNNVYLLRESTDDDERLDYFSIDLLKDNLFKTICLKCNYLVTLDKQRVINDFTLLCFLLGNDFLPHQPSLDIKNKGIDILIDVYLSVYIETKQNITSDEINWTIFMKIINKLALQENKLCINNYKKIKDAPEVIDIIKYNTDGYRDRYYTYYFGTNDADVINDVCCNYLKSILWNYNYYFTKCCSWTWHYIYDYPPLFEDLQHYTNNNFSFDLGSPLNPLTQLLIVLPRQSQDLLPDKYQHMMNTALLDLYPFTFKQDYYNKAFQWQGIPLLPPLDICRVSKNIKNIKLDIDEIKRNEIGKAFILHL